MIIKEIQYGTQEYQQTLDLRDKVMRLPLGLSIYDEDLYKEKDTYLLGAFDDEQLLGVGVVTQTENIDTLKVDYLCVDTVIQNKHIGTKLLQAIEEYALLIGKNSIVLEARITAEPFYRRLSYSSSGEKFTKAHVPIEHILMNKQLIKQS
ncbi:GNAT family N-acetyltransferase [Tetragenococcus koreensis]|uniref:GNAT family N-acetyltransferase n=1 Tax=Tetragenococcus koreensis TaxID=290335 RepID=UPI000F4F2518|nr:GNAT family N-acetyltransferase [Tetragenococcus koreensis]AYW45487.1 hypothetical protein C7K43_05765 [Tetragenococcus koreensis]MCF1584099.1 GNAT family N-acetyltransferase [Tetragenococcus koreensis]MCF1613560.1 GNAT family N-acetyltransferase [Tetragenococcus koreensis]MCF1618703.1 GNAT family N-acetyltransferase [Tetragenococcus koreensis]MCF1623231.1 GNAT family N-acetyltransferase [Tetragenococcus koreensis]